MAVRAPGGGCDGYPAASVEIAAKVTFTGRSTGTDRSHWMVRPVSHGVHDRAASEESADGHCHDQRLLSAKADASPGFLAVIRTIDRFTEWPAASSCSC